MRTRCAICVVLWGVAETALANPLQRGPNVFPVPHTGTPANALGRSSDREVPVSGTTPFGAACGVSGGTLYPSTEVEPALAVNPRDQRHWIAVWQQDRWSNGSSRGLLAGVTFDAGATWTRIAPRFSVCSGGTYQRATDPWVDFAPDGTAWQIGLVSTGASFTAGSINAVVVSRSVDGGASWSEPVELIRDIGPTFFNDKETITADPFDARYVYAVWDRLRQNEGGPTYFARTTDAGATWEPARAIYDPGRNQQTIGNLIRVLPDGTLVNLLTHLQGDEAQLHGATLEVLRSSDRGATWSEPIRVAEYQPVGAMDPSTRVPIRDGTPIAAMAAAPDGKLHVAWQDARMSAKPERDDILLASSSDGGLTWSAPVRVNAMPGASAFAPQVAVAPDGTIGVTYFDLRSDTAAVDTLLADYWLARSRDGITWAETHLAGPFDLARAPFAGGYFLGDYMGLATAAHDFLALYARTTGNPLDATNVYLARSVGAAAGATYRAAETKATRDDAGLRARVAAALDAAMARRPGGWLGRGAPR